MRTTLLFFTLLANSMAWAGDLDWSGTYRIEGFKMENPDADGTGRNKQYILHHLVLRPKITAYDGLTINGRFDILNSGTYPQSQIGQFFGSGIANNPAVPAAGSSTSDNNNILSDRQSADMIAVNELYLTYVQEFGILTAGRAPLSFGLGMTYSAGRGAFDHWFDNRDLVSYKMAMGNISFTPTIAKVVEGDLAGGDDIDDYMIEVMYENPDTELKLGAMYRIRHAGASGNVAPFGVFGDGTTSPLGSAGFEGEYLNLFFSRWVGDSFKISLEAATQEGETGVVPTAGGAVTMDAYGVALEIDWMPKTSAFHWGLKAGVASGDDANTVNTYEGFIFDRNYDVAFLLFNHPMGQFDVFRTAALKTPQSATNLASSRADEEAISNVMYVSPHFKYKWSDKFDTHFGLTYAQLNSDPISGTTVDKAVGFEVDITLNYKPYDNVQWVNRFGIFSPGAAFEGGGTFDPETVYGLETKAAITF